MSTKDDKVMRSFDTGATRDTADGKLDMEGFTHPMVEKQFAKYMNMNRLQSDGNLRASDNWQKGIPIDAYMKSLRRHHDDVWLEHRGFDTEAGLVAALCGIIFNAKGYLLEHLKRMDWELKDFDGDEPTPEMKERQAKLNEEPFPEAGQKLLEYTGDQTEIDCTTQPCRECNEAGICEVAPIEFIDTEIPSNVLRLENLQGDESINDAMKVHDDAVMEPVIKKLRAWCEEINEVLETVPELPTCFRCDNECIDCRDEPECTTHPCNECDFTDECGDLHEEDSRLDEDDKDRMDVEEGGLGAEACCGCMSLDKTWNMWPCCECRVNPFIDDTFKHNYFTELIGR
jgi:hypothetical protein